MYFIDMVHLLPTTRKQGDYMYFTKSSTVEWLLLEEFGKYSNLADTYVFTNCLKEVTVFLHNFFEQYTPGTKAEHLRYEWIVGEHIHS